MTCAHVVHVALKKLPGVETVDVSLNKGLAAVKLKPGNTLAVSSLWQTIHQNGYTPKNTVVTVRGELMSVRGETKLKVTGTGEIIALVAGPSNAEVSGSAGLKWERALMGQAVTVRGLMVPQKDFKVAVPLQVREVH